MATLPWADVFTFNGEAQLLKYRLALHSRFVSSFVVVESNVSFMGRPKSHTLMADYLLSTEDRRRYNVDVLQTPFTERERGPGNPWVKEFATRKFVTRVIADRFPSHRVYHSDVDELLDPQAVAELDVTQCIAPRLRFYYYSEHCPVNETWAGSIITRTDSTWFHRHSQRSTMLRAHAGTALSHANHACNISDAYLGWHMSYALPNEAILVKMRSFSHAYFGSIKYVLNQRDPVGRQCAEPATSGCGCSHQPILGVGADPTACGSTPVSPHRRLSSTARCASAATSSDAAGLGRPERRSRLTTATCRRSPGGQRIRLRRATAASSQAHSAARKSSFLVSGCSGCQDMCQRGDLITMLRRVCGIILFRFIAWLRLYLLRWHVRPASVQRHTGHRVSCTVPLINNHARDPCDHIEVPVRIYCHGICRK